MLNNEVMNLSTQNKAQLNKLGISEKQIEKQLQQFQDGIPNTIVHKAATINNGICKLSESEEKNYAALYEKTQPNLKLVKFVPASGAATRMFKHLQYFLKTFNPNEQKLKAYLAENESKPLEEFIINFSLFAFEKKARKKLYKKHPDFKNYSKGKRVYTLIETLLTKKGLNFNETPKGLVPFHSYKTHKATAFEEHLFEATLYTAVNQKCSVHFTYSEEYASLFEKKFKKIKKRLHKQTQVSFSITHSLQKKSTQTVAATLNNQLYKDQDKNLVFRPAGHGALIENLNEIKADLIFIKNIDNVVVQNKTALIAFYKKVLAGKLLEIQEQIYSFLKKIDSQTNNTDLIEDINQFIKNTLYITQPINTLSQAKNLLNRPIRVCGMVKNTGAPGGGPFWVKNQDQILSLQIVELSQIDTNNAQQKQIIDQATHFNPVDIVCSTIDYQGNKFDLKQYIDPSTGFISTKTHDGKPIKALELPGLWNGSMAHWTTLFIEVPLETFNPVKTVNDLLKEDHLT